MADGYADGALTNHEPNRFPPTSSSRRRLCSMRRFSRLDSAGRHSAKSPGNGPDAGTRPCTRVSRRGRTASKGATVLSRPLRPEASSPITVVEYSSCCAPCTAGLSRSDRRLVIASWSPSADLFEQKPRVQANRTSAICSTRPCSGGCNTSLAWPPSSWARMIHWADAPLRLLRALARPPQQPVPHGRIGDVLSRPSLSMSWPSYAGEAIERSPHRSDARGVPDCAYRTGFKRPLLSRLPSRGTEANPLCLGSCRPLIEIETSPDGPGPSRSVHLLEIPKA